jgi:hypothetical protein
LLDVIEGKFMLGLLRKLWTVSTSSTIEVPAVQPPALHLISGATTQEHAAIILFLNEITCDALPNHEWYMFGPAWQHSYQLIARTRTNENIGLRCKQGALSDKEYDALRSALNFPGVTSKDFENISEGALTITFSESPTSAPNQRLAVIKGGNHIESPDKRSDIFLRATQNLPYLHEYMAFYKAAVNYAFGIGPPPLVVDEPTEQTQPAAEMALTTS